MSGWCGVCRSAPRSFAEHAGTARHRQATRESADRRIVMRRRPDWTLIQHRDPLDDVSPEQLAAAEAWALG